MKKRQKKSQALIISVLGFFGLVMLLSIFGLSKSVQQIDGEIIAREPEAILANAGVTDGTSVDLPVAYWDQKADGCVNLHDADVSSKLKNRQFGWTNCGYNYKQLEKGIVAYNLGKDYLPVAVGGKMIPNRGLSNMDRWVDSVDGKSKEYSGKIKLAYNADGGSSFSFASNDFYPLDDASFSASDSENKDGHNHLFTMNFAVPFTVMASGEEYYEVSADDDTFVFMGDELVLDMGGIHDATTGKVMINEQGEVYAAIDEEEMAFSGIRVNNGDSEMIRIFHADRDVDGSVFKIMLNNMSLNVVHSELAGANGVQVAYDPSDPSYVAPLGESTVVRPDGTKGYIVMATAFGAVIIVLSVFVGILMRSLIKRRQN